MSYCERCEKEYPGLVCPVCGSPMLQEIDPESMTPDPDPDVWKAEEAQVPHPEWPLRPDGEPEAPVLLTICPDYPSYRGMAVSLLEAEGVPVQVRYSESDALGRLYGGFAPAGAELLVPESMLETAHRRLPLEGSGAGGRQS